MHTTQLCPGSACPCGLPGGPDVEVDYSNSTNEELKSFHRNFIAYSSTEIPLQNTVSGAII